MFALNPQILSVHHHHTVPHGVGPLCHSADSRKKPEEAWLEEEEGSALAVEVSHTQDIVTSENSNRIATE